MKKVAAKRIEISAEQLTCGNVNLYIKSTIDSLVGKCLGNAIVTKIIDYDPVQKYISMSSSTCSIVYDIYIVCSIVKYFQDDMTPLYINKSQGQIINVSNRHINGSVQKTIESNMLTGNEYPFVGVIKSTRYMDSEKIYADCKIYTPRPIVYKITMIGWDKPTKQFDEYLESINKIYEEIRNDPNYDELINHLFTELPGVNVPINEIRNHQVLYLHSNSKLEFPLYTDINTDEIIIRDYTGDLDYLVLHPIHNKLCVIKELLGIFPEYKKNEAIWTWYANIAK